MRFNVLCYEPDAGGFAYRGAVLLPPTDIPDRHLASALAALGVHAPRGADSVEWRDDELLGDSSRICRILDGDGQPIVCLYGKVDAPTEAGFAGLI